MKSCFDMGSTSNGQGTSVPTNFAKRCLDRRKQDYLFILLIMLTILLIVYGLHALGLLWLSSTASLSSLSELHYAVVIDAGSSGSRAYLYAWPTHSGDPHELLKISPLTSFNGNPLYKKVMPGLSSLKDNPSGALDYISPLLDFALDHIPRHKVHETPLFILATAGMRLLDKAKQEAILKHLRTGINQKFQFLFPEGNLEIISGRQEGIYQWLAINYVLGKFRHEEKPEMVVLEKGNSAAGSVETGENLVFRPRTVGAIDMGGASMQIAMEITSKVQLEELSEEDKSQVTEINLGCKDHDTEHTYRLFVTTFLGYGANEAMKRHRRDLILSQLEQESDKPILGLNDSSRLADPCLPLNFTEEPLVKFSIDKMNLTQERKASLGQIEKLYLKGTGDWAKCYEDLKSFAKSGEKFVMCQDKDKSTCHSAGIKIPSIQFEEAAFYGFSEFWYTMEDILRMGGPYISTKFARAAKKFCHNQWNFTHERFKGGHFGKTNEERLQTQCFKSAWLAVVIHEGFNFPETYLHLSSAPETVNGQVVHWTIGALLYRTRFIPLRAIESLAQEQIHYGTYHSRLEYGYLYSHYIIFFCLLLVMASILVYLQRLKRYVNPSTLRKVPSLSFWVPSKENKPSRDEEPLLTSVTVDSRSDRRPIFLT